jgi:hypothetical protein
LTVSGFDEEAGERVPLEGARLCETDTTNCDLADGNGAVTIDLPLGREYSYTLEKEGYGSNLVADLVQSSAGGGYGYDWTMGTDQVYKEQHDRVMSPYPMRGTGTILVQLSPQFSGATYELVDATGEAFYSDEEGLWSLDLSETTSRGRGGFVEVSPGDDFQINFGGQARRCVSSPFGWPGNVDNSVRFPVREGHLTYIEVRCTLP